MPILLALLIAASPASFVMPGGPTIDAADNVGDRPPPVTADAWLLYDTGFDYEIASFAADEPRPMASTTKLMTALLVDELAEHDDLVEVSGAAAATGQKQVHLQRGEIFTVGDLLATLMVVSANDAAVALAEHVAGSVPAFVDLMNERAAALGMTNTSFRNPHGLDAWRHYTTASDLLLLAREVMERPVLAELATRRSVRFDGAVYETTNELVATQSEGVIGLKTGFTRRAGRVLVAVAERDDRRIYAVVMGSENSFADARALLDYGFRTFLEPELKLVELMSSDDVPTLIAALPEAVADRVLHVWGHRRRLVAAWE